MTLPMWRFIPHSDYMDTWAHAPEPAKRFMEQIWEHFFSSAHSVTDSEVEFVSPDLQSAPVRLLDWVVPPPRWQEECGLPAPASLDALISSPSKIDSEIESSGAADANLTTLSAAMRVNRQLSHSLNNWQGHRTSGPGVQMILAAPHSGIDAMVRGWAQGYGYLMPPLPTSQQVLDSENSWLDDLRGTIAEVPKHERDRTRLVLTGLEEYFLRHHSGLDFLRRVMDYLVTEAPPSLIVCDSWAWAYLRKALHMDAMVRPPLTLERITGEMLKEWLLELSSKSHHRKFIFRQGEQVLCTIGISEIDSPITSAQIGGGTDTPDRAGMNKRSIDRGAADQTIIVNHAAFDGYCDQLAEMSRGNPGVARAIWRRSLSNEASDDVHEQVKLEAAEDPGYKIWIQPLDETLLPVVPSTFTNEDAFILQTLLIHDGLTRRFIEATLPLSASLISRRLQIMFNAGLIRNSDNRERDDRAVNELLDDNIIEVSPVGYIPARNFLRDRGFFVDDL